MPKKTASLLAAVLISFFCFLECPAETLLVGVSQDEPLLFRDRDGNVKGICIDILEYAAQKEGWKLVYRFGSWEQNVKMLEEGDVDILPGMAYAKDRESQFAFNTENIVANWGQIYLHEKSAIRSFAELDGKRVAATKKDVYFEFFETAIQKFDIFPIFVEVDSYDEVLLLLNKKRADAGILPHLYAKHHDGEKGVVESSLSFLPTQIRYAVKRGDKEYIVQCLDRHLVALKKNRNSIFYRSINLWVEGVNKLTFPGWIRPLWVLCTVGGIFLLFLVGNVILRHQVRTKTEALRSTIAAKERLESELRIARDIQMGLLPAHFPAEGDIPGVEIFARLEPAKEIGGDFFDFFPIDSEKLCLVIGDVSGKGIPAALFMSMAKTMIKSTARMIEDPGEILAAVNREIAVENDACMFVTVFLGVLNVRTGELRYCNAGHTHPLLIQRGTSPKLVKGGESPAIGIDEDAAFQMNALVIQPLEIICLYTDGVTEALNRDEEMFTGARLIRSVSGMKDAGARSIVEGIAKHVETFSRDAVQADDITVLALKYCPEEWVEKKI